MSRLLTLCLVLVLLAGGVFGVRLGIYAVTPSHPQVQAITQEKPSPDTIEIRKGETNGEIARQLQAKQAISDIRWFNWLGRITGNWKKVKAGEYEVSGSMTPLQIFEAITSGLSVIHPVTVREGENMYEIAADLESKALTHKEDFLALCKDPKFIGSLGVGKEPTTLEGFLYPDTYYFNKTLTAQDMVVQMVRHANQIWTAKDEAAARQLGMSRFKIVTLASIIEKETGAPQERPLIASVFYNRLRKHMKLQSDPTTIYGMWATYKGNIHKSDLLAANDYNTYYVAALPIGPIANPGREALDAALAPSESTYLFFVSHNNGTHEFTSSLADHNRAVQKFQMDPKAREGKSWRDLNKKKTD
jgi:UPF0755 protein